MGLSWEEELRSKTKCMRTVDIAHSRQEHPERRESRIVSPRNETARSTDPPAATLQSWHYESASWVVRWVACSPRARCARQATTCTFSSARHAASRAGARVLSA